jgi:endonuclease III
VAAAVIADGTLNALWQCVEIADEFFGGFAGEIVVTLEGFIKLHHVSVVMLAVMNLHGLSVDVRLERIVRVWKVR